jgi:hypothetical protein
VENVQKGIDSMLRATYTPGQAVSSLRDMGAVNKPEPPRKPEERAGDRAIGSERKGQRFGIGNQLGRVPWSTSLLGFRRLTGTP